MMRTTSDERKRSSDRVTIAIGIVFALSGLALGIILGRVLDPFFASIASEKINIGSQMILQFDSFLTAGWSIAFFQYWGGLEKAMTESRRSRLKLITRGQATVQSNSALDAQIYRSMQEREQQDAPTRLLFVEAISSVLMFIGSALASVTAVLTSDGTFLSFALAFLVLGVVLMIGSWFDLWKKSKRLQTQSDWAVSRAG